MIGFKEKRIERSSVEKSHRVGRGTAPSWTENMSKYLDHFDSRSPRHLSMKLLKGTSKS
jgi:hypothetical protein